VIFFPLFFFFPPKSFVKLKIHSTAWVEAPKAQATVKKTSKRNE
jgi:hypothetical protein